MRGFTSSPDTSVILRTPLFVIMESLDDRGLREARVSGRKPPYELRKYQIEETGHTST
ncbi:hypothetical protein [Streptomyces sp. ST2-7A]|uniref:hypothetical protein n=1 Tax=Streptomyces sp. ST2-7A TaxID=2907214 RepID=UPI001F187EDC|nr:hypothetical protein [Streptomyces sp. ST2-7A]